MQNITFTIKTRFRDKLISDIDLENVIQKALSLKIKQITFNWNDPEVLASDFSFYEKVVEIQNRFRKANLQVANIVTAKAQYITEGAAEFFKKYNFVVEITVKNNIFDVQTIKAVETLNKFKTEFTLIAEVTEKNHNSVQSFYDFCKERNWNYLGLKPQRLSGKTWSNVLNGITKKWFKNDTKKISINVFDAVLFKMLLNKPEPASGIQKRLNEITVNYKGNFYLPFSKTKIAEKADIVDLLNNLKMPPVSQKCHRCKVFEYCGGDIPENLNSESQRSVLCDGWYDFFIKNLKLFKKLTAKLKQERIKAKKEYIRNIAAQQNVTSLHQCPCGSGKIFKNCCQT